jgi:glycosyltransferase involved in cell wall biosynthesis
MVITTFNRVALLVKSLSHLAALTLPDELLIVDDGGDDETPQVCEEFRQYMPIRYIYNHNPGTTICSMARNIGIKQAKHDWIITSEPELIYDTDIVAQFLDCHSDHPEQVISAGHITFAPEGWIPGRPVDGQVAVGWVAPHTALWKKEWLMAVGGWDESFPGPWGWDDTDLLTRLRINGIGQHIEQEMRAIHQFHGLGADAGSMNEAHFLAKSFTVDEMDTRDVVANQGREWGVIVPR